MKNSKSAEAAGRGVPPPGECICVTLRRAARAFSQVYDEALAPAGLRITQFSLLRAIVRQEPVTIGELAQAQALDRSTLSRNLLPLERLGLVRQEPGADRRTSQVRVTSAGRAAIARALPLWRRTQQNIRDEFGDASLAKLRALNSRAEALVSAAHRLRNE